MVDKYDFVVFGASGFTGKYVCKELLKTCTGQDVKVAFAGRNRKKLEDVASWIQQDASIEFGSDVGLIVADVEDEQSLLNMCKQSRILLDCVGPYKLWGEVVVKACIEARSDYIDITGEPEYMERIKVKYHNIAIERGVYIVSACGFDSIPSELGVIFAKEKFRGTLATVENYFKMRHGKSGMTGNFGTYASIVNGFADISSLQALRKANRPKPLPLCGQKSKLKGIHYNSFEKTYALPFPGADVSIVKRSQRFYFEQFQEIPLQFSMYMCCDFLKMLSLILFGIILKIFTSFSWGKDLMLNHPKVFTAGAFSKQGPTEEQMAESGFQFTMYCKGYRNPVSFEELTDGTARKDPFDSEMVVKIAGPEIGYVLTPIVLVQSALCVKEERASLPSSGGVYTPGPALKKTTLLERVQQHGVTFEIIQQ